MGEQKFSMKPVVQACEEALVTAGGSGDGQDMRVSSNRGRDARCRTPPAQIRTGPIRAYGSYLGYLTAKRCCGQG